MSYVVIGSNFGDEGKGLMTDYLTRKTGADTVCRFNGGGQAGHTVVSGNKRHVFGHIASGTFAGADTLLGRQFIVNPLVLAKELVMFPNAQISASADAIVTTIFDMMINAEVERARGNERHGSCGLGINETVTRSEAPGMTITLGQLKEASTWMVAKGLQYIAQKWVPKRLAELGITISADSMLSTLCSQTDFTRDAQALKDGANRIDIYDYAAASPNVVFEGAQGLALDEFLGVFPHVTRSMTGLPNAIAEAAAMGIKVVRPVYVTRAYTTRHGRGPLNGEGLLSLQVEDTTNTPNEFQEKLRFAPLDVHGMARLIKADLNRSEPVARFLGIKIDDPVVAVSCMDQVDNTAIQVIGSHGQILALDLSEFLTYVEYITGLPIRYVSRGATAADVIELSP